MIFKNNPYPLQMAIYASLRIWTRFLTFQMNIASNKALIALCLGHKWGGGSRPYIQPKIICPYVELEVEPNLWDDANLATWLIWFKFPTMVHKHKDSPDQPTQLSRASCWLSSRGRSNLATSSLGAMCRWSTSRLAQIWNMFILMCWKGKLPIPKGSVATRGSLTLHLSLA